MFIHWGIYAVPAGEWNGKTVYGEWIMNSAHIPLPEYERFRERFNPVKFDAGAWVRLAKAAGMKYIVITTKHHDGFCLFDSRETDYDVMSTPFRRDIMKEIAEACRREGVRVGWYHSIMDWHHPDYLPRRDWETRPAEGADFGRYVRYLKAQVRELLTSYGPVGVMWFDGEWEGSWTNERGRDLYAYVRSLQPDVLVNNRVGRAGGDFGIDREQGLIGDFGTPEQEIPATGIRGVDWETCMTMNDHWGYNRADTNFKSAPELIRMLADIASKGGNFLLNVCPTPEGEIPPQSVERLEAIGRWMAVNGEAIHGTGASPFRDLPWGRCTTRPLPNGSTRLYLHIFDWPRDGRLVLKGILNEPAGARLLGAAGTTGAAPLIAWREGEAMVVRLPPAPPDPVDSVVALDVRGSPDMIDPPTISADTDIFVDTLEVRVATDRDNVVARVTTDGSEPLASSAAVDGPLRLRATTTVSARLFRGDRAVSPVVRVTYTKVTPRPAERVGTTVPGLRFDCVEGDFEKLPDFDESKSAKSGVVAGFDLAPRTRERQFALRFRGYIRIPRDGAYRLFTRSDDGSRLWIGDRLVVDNDGLHSSHERSGVIALAAGLHPITVAMFEQGGGFELSVSWSGPDLPKQIVPASALFRTK